VLPRRTFTALLIALLGWISPLRAQDASDIIRGQVVGPDKKPVENVTVTATSYEHHADHRHPHAVWGPGRTSRTRRRLHCYFFFFLPFLSFFLPFFFAMCRFSP